MTQEFFKRLVTLVVGISILLLGVAMLVLPGPGLIVIPVGIVVLAGEFAWARRLRRRMEEIAPSLDGLTNDTGPTEGPDSQERTSDRDR